MLYYVGTSRARLWLDMITMTNGQVVTLEYTAQCNNGNVDAWKCPITVIYETGNKEKRTTHRFDWCGGWVKENFCSATNNGAMWCGSMEEYLSVAQDCTVRATYTFVDGTLTETYTITANSGTYAGNVYFWSPSVSGIQSESITVALIPEFTKVSLVSVKY